MHFRVFTLISKNLEEDINKRNHENEISELQRKHQNEIAELQRKHALEVTALDQIKIKASLILSPSRKMRKIVLISSAFSDFF